MEIRLRSSSSAIWRIFALHPKIEKMEFFVRDCARLLSTFCNQSCLTPIIEDQYYNFAKNYQQRFFLERVQNIINSLMTNSRIHPTIFYKIITDHLKSSEKFFELYIFVIPQIDIYLFICAIGWKKLNFSTFVNTFCQIWNLFFIVWRVKY